MRPAACGQGEGYEGCEDVKKDYICHRTSCIYHAPDTMEESCHYLLITGKCKLPLMDPLHRDPEHCPVYREGKRLANKDQPMVSEKPKKGYRIDRDRLRELYRAGLNDVAIARQLGCTPEGVLYWRRTEGLPANTRTPRKEGGDGPERDKV